MMKDNGHPQSQGRRLSRRGLLRGAAGVAIGSLGLAAAGCSSDEKDITATAVPTSGPAASSAVIGPVEQNRLRRLKLGLTAWDPSKTFDGYTLFAPLQTTGKVYLIDMEGNFAHKWDIKLPPQCVGYHGGNILPNGNLFYVPQAPTGEAPWFVFKGSILMEVDWDGNILWQLNQPDHHHDARMLPNGNMLTLNTELTPPDVAARVKGGLPDSQTGQTWCDYVTEVTREGEIVWEWHAWEHLDTETDIMNSNDSRQEWTHGNSVEQLPDGNILVSFRNINTIGIVDRASGDFVWKLGPPTIAQQHDPTMLPNGNILIFDNGAHRFDSSLPYSRVIEVDPKTNEIVWKYADKAMLNFFSPYISGAQRLPNGNTLITEGNFGRLFEVTTEGEIVWEYINPFFGPDPLFGEGNFVFRSTRYTKDELPHLKT